MTAWRNRRTGRVVDLPDQPPGGDRAEVAQFQRMLDAMAASRRWERLDDDSQPAAGESESDPGDATEKGGTPADVPGESWSRDRLREEAQRRGLAVGGTKGELLDRLRS